MPYLVTDDCMDTHPKIEDLSDRAYRLHMSGLYHCARNLTDGLVSQTTVRGLCARLRATRKHVAELVDADVWVDYGSRGFIIKNYLDWNPSKAEVEERREKRASAGRLGGQRSGDSRRSKSEASALASASKQNGSSGLNPIQSNPKDQVLLAVDNSLRSVNG